MRHTNKYNINSLNWDMMLKSFINTYNNIPSKEDINLLIKRIDHIEKLIKQAYIDSDVLNTQQLERKGTIKVKATASSVVLDAIKHSRGGADFSKLQNKTGFEDKKLRNIIFRLNKLGRIKRKSRGIYVAA